MTKVEFVINFDQIRANGIRTILDKNWYEKEGYNIVYPNLSKEIMQEIESSRELILQNRYIPSTEIKEAFKKEAIKFNLEEFKKKVEENWKPIEQKFFELAPKIVGKQWHHENYTCYFTPYGPGGSYDGQTYKYFVIKFNKNFTNKNRTIMHELIHCLIQEEIKSNNIEHWTKERIVDSYLARTDLKNLFENIPRIHRKEISNPVDEIFEKTTNIYEIMEEISISKRNQELKK